MANLPGILTLHVLDADNVPSTYQEYVVFTDALTAAQLATHLQNVATDVDAIIAGQIYKGTLQIIVEGFSGLKGAPEADSRVSDTGLFTFRAANTRYPSAIDVPSIDEEFVNKGVIAPAGAVLTWESNLFAPAVAVTATDKNGNALEAVAAAKETFRKHRRSLKNAASRPTPE
jgi:hypothetical protein